MYFKHLYIVYGRLSEIKKKHYYFLLLISEEILSTNLQSIYNLDRTCLIPSEVLINNYLICDELG